MRWILVGFVSILFLVTCTASVQGANDAEFVSQSVPSSMMAGQVYNVSVTMRNNGSSTWSKTSLYHLGSQNPPNNDIWGNLIDLGIGWGNVSRIELADDEYVVPGSTKNFTFTVRAPLIPGIYSFQWRMAEEWVGWFGETTPNVVVNVNATPHIIGIRLKDGRGELYDKRTGEEFVIRGNCYFRLPSDHYEYITFDVGVYDPVRADSALQKMEEYGYNTVEISPNQFTIGNPNGTGLDMEYLANIADFLHKAKSHNIFVILRPAWLPTQGGYWPPDLVLPRVNMNWHYLSPEVLAQKQRYLKDIIIGLRELGAPLEIIIIYKPTGEYAYNEGKDPLNLTSGIVTTIAGDFDMSDPNQKQFMMDRCLVEWSDKTREVILSVDPTALTETEFYAPIVLETFPNTAITRPYYGIANPENGGSSVDIIGLSMYPEFGFTFDELMRNIFEDLYGPQPNTRKLIIVHEYGIPKKNNPDVVQVANRLISWQTDSCNYGISGWIFFTWDTVEFTYWSAMEENEYIANALSPLSRPVVCIDGNPIAHYEFEGDANDNSPYANHGIIHGNPVFETGKVDQGIRLDGVDDYVEIPDTREMSGGYPLIKTVEAWFKLDDVSGNRDIVGKQFDGNLKDWVLIVQNGLLKYYSESAGEDYRCPQTTGSISSGVWYHGAFVVDEPNVYVYVNGELVGSCSNLNGNSIDTDAPVEIGAATYTPRYTPGIIDDVMVYSTALTQEEIRNHFNLATDPDVDEDGDVDIFDIIELTSRFGMREYDALWNSKMDVIVDGEIDIYDLVFVASRFT